MVPDYDHSAGAVVTVASAARFPFPVPGRAIVTSGYLFADDLSASLSPRHSSTHTGGNFAPDRGLQYAKSAREKCASSRKFTIFF